MRLGLLPALRSWSTISMSCKLIMSNQSSRNESGDTAISKAQLEGLGAWHPLLIGLTKSNGHVAQGLGLLFSEWQNFLGHRLQQDLLLWRKVAVCASPQEVASAYMQFWEKAVADYWQESATMSKLLAGVTAKLFSQVPTAALEGGKAATSRKAA